jgi:succinate dehydrogenase/fumarate reductase flavoprotein subunit
MEPTEPLEVEVAVIGAGPAGGSAAIEAARAGASVCVVETTGELGGNGAFSTGYLAFADSAFQRERGISDDADQLVSDMVREVEALRPAFDPELDMDLARRYAEESAAAYDFMVELGFRFVRIIPRPRQHTTGRMITLEDPTSFRSAFADAFEREKITALLRHKAHELGTRDGRVCSVVARRGAGPESIEIRARSGVVVAAGGFAANPEMRLRYRPDDDPYAPFVGLDTADGSGIAMMEALGADLINMALIPQYVEGPSRFVEDCIAINGEGHRFYDEAGPYLERTAALRQEPGGIGYYLYDLTTAERNVQHIAEVSGRPKSFATLAEVERAIGCEPGAVEETVRRWNALMDSQADRDPDFGRVVFPADRARIETPPFSTVPLSIGIGNTNGGVRVSTDLEVLDTEGRVIPGLFAVGDCAGSVNAAVGLGGVHLGSAVTLGRIAGRGAAGA